MPEGLKSENHQRTFVPSFDKLPPSLVQQNIATLNCLRLVETGRVCLVEVSQPIFDFDFLQSEFHYGPVNIKQAKDGYKKVQCLAKVLQGIYLSFFKLYITTKV